MTREAGPGDGESDDSGTVGRRDLGLGHPLSPEDERATDAAGGAESTAGQAARTDDGGRVSRRQLLGGTAAGLAVAAGGGWLLRGSGGSRGGADAVVVEYVNAIADNDWAAAGALYHEASEFGAADLSYDAYLSNREQLDTLETLSPSVEGTYTSLHVTDVEGMAEAEDGLFIGENVDPATVDAWVQVIALISVRTDRLDVFGEESREYVSETSTVPVRASLVREGNDWSILRAFAGLLPF